MKIAEPPYWPRPVQLITDPTSLLGKESAAPFRAPATHGDVDWFVASLDGFESRPEIVVLAPEEVDTQQPHENDEVYHVVRGFGQLTVGDRVEHVGPGTLVRVTAGVPPRFHDVQEKLVVLVFPNHGHH